MAEISDRLGRFLRSTVAAVRERFHGKVTYAAIPFEGVDWDLFDVVTLELIRSAEVADQFRDGVRRLVDQPKPVAVTGFGTATWRGAGDVAPRSMEIIEYDATSGTPQRLNGVYERDEDGQAAYLRELLDIFDSEGVDSAFVHLFALPSLPHRPDGDPRYDLDLASPGSSRCSTAAPATRTPGCPGSRRPRSPPSPSTTRASLRPTGTAERTRSARRAVPGMPDTAPHRRRSPATRSPTMRRAS
ncbi:hypothetical protein GA0070216_106151 [Micromonospora matsumotoense]|uniref:Uncharacterized protein n=1 Tax=Micromonospora matsumotoense TaxID=121616 RepID=A0A1C4YER4_9ACTN|nr:hypothetical protein [Micromonospora matsumotoense]SCF19198.1 hypothetical protein GA0070216_106151 [Micromonospora matsumotoense]